MPTHCFLFFVFCFFFIVLPVYCYQPVTLHPHAHMLSHVTPWTAASQAPLSMDFSRQEYWSGLPFPSPQLIVFFSLHFLGKTRHSYKEARNFLHILERHHHHHSTGPLWPPHSLYQNADTVSCHQRVLSEHHID